jgi:hypothetical protein
MKTSQRVSLIMVGLVVFAGQASALDEQDLPRITCQLAHQDVGAMPEPSVPVDPIIEEPIRPLYSEGVDSPANRPADCGPLGTLILPLSLLVVASLRFAPFRRPF